MSSVVYIYIYIYILYTFHELFMSTSCVSNMLFSLGSVTSFYSYAISYIDSSHTELLRIGSLDTSKG